MPALTKLLVAPMVLMLTACSGVIIAPETPEEPVSVFVLDHGRHSSLVLPLQRAQTDAVRYAYGDWDYYVLRRTSLMSGVNALLRPTPAALSRELLQGPYEAEALSRNTAIEVVASHEIRVPAHRVRQLNADLEAAFFQGWAQRMRWPHTDVFFVPHPQPYTLRRNSNRMVAVWLETLGATVTGNPVLSKWRVRQPRQSD